MDPTPWRFEIEKFDRKGDFGLWKFKMMTQLEIQGLVSVLQKETSFESDITKLEEGVEVKKNLKKAERDLRVRSLFITCLSDVILRKIMNETTTLRMVKPFERDYQSKSLPNFMYLKKKFSCFRMEENKPMEENFYSSFLKLLADLASIKIYFSDEDQAIQLISGLPTAYEPLVHTIQYGTRKATLTVNEVITAAYSKEAEIKQKRLTTRGIHSKDLYSESRGRTSTINDSGNNKQWNNKLKSRFRPKSVGKYNVKQDKTCWICGSDGHWKLDCPERKKTSHSLNLGNSANVAKDLSGPIALTVSLIVSHEEWVLESGCTFHITQRMDLLSEFVEFEGNKVMMGKNSFCIVRGMGKITIDNKDGSSVTLSEVRYIPEVERNLISYGQLEQSGCSYNGRDYMVRFYKGGREVLSGMYNN